MGSMVKAKTLSMPRGTYSLVVSVYAFRKWVAPEPSATPGSVSRSLHAVSATASIRVVAGADYLAKIVDG